MFPNGLRLPMIQSEDRDKGPLPTPALERGGPVHGDPTGLQRGDWAGGGMELLPCERVGPRAVTGGDEADVAVGKGFPPRVEGLQHDSRPCPGRDPGLTTGEAQGMTLSSSGAIPEACPYPSPSVPGCRGLPPVGASIWNQNVVTKSFCRFG